MSVSDVQVGSDTNQDGVQIWLDGRISHLSSAKAAMLLDMLITHLQAAGNDAALDAVREQLMSAQRESDASQAQP